MIHRITTAMLRVIHRNTTAMLIAVATFLIVWSSAYGCVQEYGTIAESAAIAGAHFTYAYNGLEWANTFEKCRGQRQSPVLLPVAGAAGSRLEQPEAKSSFSYGTLTNPKIVNNGRTLQVSIPADFRSDVNIPIKGSLNTSSSLSILTPGPGEVSYVRASPAQFHFHTTSEHIMSGAEYAMEMHIVHFILPDQLPACAAVKGYPGCPVVLGNMLSLTMNESDVKPELRRLIEAMPLHEGRTANMTGPLDVGALLPSNMTYVTYEGSLTTPPCDEGILWHVLTTPLKISQSLLTRYQEAVGDLYCPDDDGKDKEDEAEQLAVANGTFFTLPPKNKNGCVKLANGHNYRGIQPMNGRVVKLAT